MSDHLQHLHGTSPRSGLLVSKQATCPTLPFYLIVVHPVYEPITTHPHRLPRLPSSCTRLHVYLSLVSCLNPSTLHLVFFSLLNQMDGGPHTLKTLGTLLPLRNSTLHPSYSSSQRDSASSPLGLAPFSSTRTRSGTSK